MLGYDVYVHELGPHVREEDIRNVAQVPLEERTRYVGTLVSRRMVHIPCGYWVDQLLTASESGPVLLLRGDGYPYLFCATGADIKNNYTGPDIASVSALINEREYVVEAWDRS